MKASSHTQIALTAALLLGFGAAAHAQTIVGGLTPVVVGGNIGDNSQTTNYGKDGYILFDTTSNGSSQTGYDSFSNIITQTAGGLANIIVQPSYVSSLNGLAGTYVGYGGYYGNINPGVGSGIVGNTSGNYFSFTVGAGVPTVFNFGILTNYTNAGEEPTTITLTSGAATAPDTPSQAVGYSGRDNLFTITGASPGQTFTVNVSNKFISGATFDTLVPAPEPSPSVALAVGILGLGLLGMKARRRAASVV